MSENRFSIEWPFFSSPDKRLSFVKTLSFIPYPKTSYYHRYRFSVDVVFRCDFQLIRYLPGVFRACLVNYLAVLYKIEIYYRFVVSSVLHSFTIICSSCPKYQRPSSVDINHEQNIRPFMNEREYVCIFWPMASCFS